MHAASRPGSWRRASSRFWFSYDLDGRQLWLIGEGTGAHGQYQIEFLRPVGTHFGAAFDPSAVQRQPWGSATVSFSTGLRSTSTSATARPSPVRLRQSELTRLTAPIGSGYYCPTPSATAENVSAPASAGPRLTTTSGTSLRHAAEHASARPLDTEASPCHRIRLAGLGS
jgi:hypothetical protein